MDARLDIINEGDVVLTLHPDALQCVHQLCRDLVEKEAIAELKLSSVLKVSGDLLDVHFGVYERLDFPWLNSRIDGESLVIVQTILAWRSFSMRLPQSITHGPVELIDPNMYNNGFGIDVRPADDPL